MFAFRLAESVPGSARDLQGVSGDTAHLSEGTAQPEGGRSIQYITHNPHPFPKIPLTNSSVLQSVLNRSVLYCRGDQRPHSLSLIPHSLSLTPPDIYGAINSKFVVYFDIKERI